MSTKAVIQPIQVLTAGDMSGPLTSKPSNVMTSDNVAYQIVYTGTPNGTFNIEGSLDGVNWSALTFSTQPNTGNAPSGTLFNLNQVPFLMTRLTYNGTGAGALTVTVMSKRLGG